MKLLPNEFVLTVRGLMTLVIVLAETVPENCNFPTFQ